MKYEYKVVVVDKHELKELNSFLADGWEVFSVTPETVSTGSNYSTYYGAMFFTIRKEK